MKLDLHIHTSASDGAWSPAQVVLGAVAGGVSASALPDLRESVLRLGASWDAVALQGIPGTGMPSMRPYVSAEEVAEFDQRVRKVLEGETDEQPRYACEPKWDGVSASLTYEDGLFVRGLSRGDGTTGEDLTGNLKAVGGVPLRLRGKAPALVEVRGEVMLPLKRFEEINAALVEAGVPRSDCLTRFMRRSPWRSILRHYGPDRGSFRPLHIRRHPPSCRIIRPTGHNFRPGFRPPSCGR